MLKQLTPAQPAIPAAEDKSAVLVPWSSRGLVGVDFSKFASRTSEGILKQLDSIKVQPGEALVHLYAMGATERYGCNRNGDGFKAAMLRRYHPTFVKSARWYRDHKHKDPSKSYGVVKASHYREDLDCVELLVGLNGNAKMASANGGLVADMEMDSLHSGKPMQVSMAINVPYDVCSYCGNKARTPAHYCTQSTCKAGGLKKNMGRLVKVAGEYHHLHADNQSGEFFDISHITRGPQADRIAYVTALVKQGNAIGDFAVPPQQPLVLPEHLVTAGIYDPQTKKLASILAQAAETEARLADMPPLCDSVQLPEPPGGIDKIGQQLLALSEQNILLPLSGFLQLVTGQTQSKLASCITAVRQELPGQFGILRDHEDRLEKLADCKYWPSATTSRDARQWAKKLARFSLTHDQILSRLAHVQPRRKEQVKLASSDSPSSVLAAEYVMYKLAFLASRKTHSELTVNTAVFQN